MKKIVIAALCALFVLAGCSTTSGSKEVLKVYSWGVYIGETVRAQFEEKYNVEVIYDEFDSNETMYTTLQKGEAYDVLVPSDYMIERLIGENFLQSIDLSKISNYDGVVESLKGLSFDPENEYSVPYFWGNVGIVYNKNNVSLTDLESEGWATLKNPKYTGRVFAYNSQRDSFMMALKNLGYSMNTEDASELEAAYNWLAEMNVSSKPIYGGDEIISSMIDGVKDLAVMYSGDATYILTENEEMDFYVPTEGTNIWTDSMVIPANANNVDLAHKWINFMLEPEIALENTEEVGYTSTVQSVIDEVTATGGAYEGISSYVARVGDQHDEIFIYNAKVAEELSKYWSLIIAQ